jgi:hypothetical protein
MDILIESDFNVALHNFVEKDDRTAIEEFVKGRLSSVQELLRKQNPDHVNNLDDIQKFVISNTSKNREIQDAKNESKPKIKLQMKDDENDNDEDDMNDMPSIKSEKASTQKKTKAAGGKKLLTKRGKKKQSSEDDDEVSDDNSFIVDDDVPVTKKKTQTRAVSQRTQTQTKKRAHPSSEEDSDGSEDTKSKPPAKKTRGTSKGVATKQTKLTPSKTATKSQLNFFDMTDEDDTSSSNKSGSSISDSINVNSNSWGGKKTKK